MGDEKRLAMLEKITQGGGADSFAWYGLALEYKSFGRTDDALRTFRHLRDTDPDYRPMYLMCGTMLVAAGRPTHAREWLETGLLKAREKGETHAERELSEAIEQIPPPPSLA